VMSVEVDLLPDGMCFAHFISTPGVLDFTPPRTLDGGIAQFGFLKLDHVIVLGEKHLRRILRSYFDYYGQSRTHLSLGKDAPLARRVQPPEAGIVVELPQVGGLHHRYERRAA